jgi:hypothetical protein
MLSEPRLLNEVRFRIHGYEGTVGYTEVDPIFKPLTP